ncbi:VCBS repeat-containing protein [Lacihabitans soyangensis]|uniref:RNA-binding protein n=1 Tax=Lacihabitans soyangensis TaxID=869394 RepID=A0AAE3KXT1_9BACT|nr:VCBS repeat-containing protein [Lacihabitans soyangensis]MCP9765700.1 RNA-binding protein [Lacihabitans soyangensis]
MLRLCFYFLLLLLFGCQKSKEKPLFELVPEEESGFSFVNELNETEQLNILTYEYLYNGSGVAIGDINNDGLPDIFMGGNLFGGRLYLNKGNLKFEQISETANVFYRGFTTGVSMVDINQDGWLDIYICRSLDDDPNNRANLLLINNQDNTFTERAKEFGLADTGYSTVSNFFDFDNDGDLDMFLVNHRVDFKNALTLNTFIEKGTKRVKTNSYSPESACKLFQNNGNQTFTDISAKAGIMNTTFGLSASVGDINNDGWSDIFVASDYADKDLLYINNQNGTFTDKIDAFFEHISKNSMGSDMADFNNDGLLDLISLDMVSEDNFRQKQLKGNSPYDKYMLAASVGLHHQVVRNTLQLNNCDGTFSEIAQLAGVSHTDWSWAPLFADFDNDGWKDLYISNGYAHDVTDFDFTKYDSDAAIQKTGGKISSLELVNHMKKTPVSNYAFRNNKDLTFSNQTRNWGLEIPSFSNGAAYSDLDLDGDLDLVVNNFNSKAFLFKNNSRNINQNGFLNIVFENPKASYGAKVWVTTKDTKQFFEFTPYKGFMSSVDNKIHVGLGKNHIIDELKVEWKNGKSQVLKNVKPNQAISLKMNQANYQKSVIPTSEKTIFTQDILNFTYLENDFVDFKREPLLEQRLSDKGPYVSQGDLNADGLSDFFVGGSAGNSATILFQNDQKKFTTVQQKCFLEDKHFEDAGSAIFDIDKDGDFDILTASGGYEHDLNSENYALRLYLNNGKGIFEKSKQILNLKTNASELKLADIDVDGDMDVFIAGHAMPSRFPYAVRSFLLLNDNGILKNVSNRLPENGNLGVINDAEWVDIDNDKSLELVIAGEWMPITVLKYQGGKYVHEKSLNQAFVGLNGWWNCLEFGDVDKDGDLDLIAGNRGENSFFKPNKTTPAVIYANDFDNNGAMDAIPVYPYNVEKLYPKHTLDELANQIPSIKKRMSRYEYYSKAQIEDVFSKSQIEKSLRKEAHTAQTMFFINDGKGRFSERTLPMQVQFSAVKDVLMNDLDSDGNMDVLMVGNEYGTDVDSGRQDASFGCFLKGDGKGGFKVVSNKKAGIKLKGNARKITVSNGGNQILVWMNQSQSIILKK